tara:strand:- start:1871 stop:2323 length:453 start_codon:yes stop_codon:yes gene_type:complete
MRYILIFFLFTSLAFSQNHINESDLIGKWEINIKVKKLIKEETKKLDMLEKLAAKLASEFAEDIINDIDMYIIFNKNGKATVTVDFIDYAENEEINWSINQNNEIVIDDSLNKKINIGSENNIWILEDNFIFLKENSNKMNRNIFLKRSL